MIQGHGDDIYDYEGIIRHNFSSNVYHALRMPGLEEHLCHCIGCIGNYPPAEATQMERMLGIRHGNRQHENLITNGATEAIYLTALAANNHGESAQTRCRSAVVVPTFSEYEDACRLYGHEVIHISSLDEVTDDVNMVWLCNPNNPTGTVISKKQIVEAAFRHHHTVFVIDQSYACFCTEELLQPREAAQMGNVILLHSMTKQYAIPGLRLGFVTGPMPLIDTLRMHRMPWSVNALAIEAFAYILENEQRYRFDIAAYLHEAQRLNAAINGIEGLEALPTRTHFMLVRMDHGDSILLKRKLVDEYGILIRSAHNFVGLNRHYFRVAAQSEEENNLLVDALKDIINRI
ncbi:MAG: aminotransferase class I/II-fold pyridoxal phosphate-dependent enzyme [Prevotella sp.]|nr:aminotransferase class I/II-fold pyridoxal phosphate-dependent enzyme [Prevotella sp.]